MHVYIAAKERTPYIDRSPAPRYFYCAACKRDDDDVNQARCRNCGTTRGSLRRLTTQAQDPAGLAQRRLDQR